ncbi:hypothetical protein [Leptospira terpstrae]|uniref:Uncharacterized protein n=1 Tax=Leptospira terpstrae serovar Hualin str. LT 11-33 = ATCC 700639 TaxID=1257025 RepID=N1VSR5_9LEPT|nr:hypothetical protein [Leptospira terpstrae]EMY60027.1 hypothetical protein LEP1GSC203_1061 [Leptospira terpstrae serovar Hualin str. LT 11-33 = ATCC 700639]
MFIKKIILLTATCFFGCIYDSNTSEIRILGNHDLSPHRHSRVYIYDQNYQNNVFSYNSPLKFFFLDHIPSPEQKPTEEWKNHTIRIIFFSDENLINNHKHLFKFEKIQDIYSELILLPNNNHIINEFDDVSIFIFLMFDYQPRYRYLQRSMIGFPLNVELRVSIFKNKIEIASCQQIVIKNIFTNNFLEIELKDEVSVFHQLISDKKIDLMTDNLFINKITFCLEKLKIKN